LAPHFLSQVIRAAFIVSSVFLLVSAFASMFLRNLIHCALCLAIAFASLAALYLQLGAQFVGLVQILVYIGAVAILIVFAILLTRSGEKAQRTVFSSAWWVGAVVALAVFGGLAASILASHALKRPSLPVPEATAKRIGEELMTNFVLPLEVIGLLLTAALIGAILIAMQEKRA
jgi:NADH:ubiquinone oxidoreductase subunit 6 (subunit J)